MTLELFRVLGRSAQLDRIEKGLEIVAQSNLLILKYLEKIAMSQLSDDTLAVVDRVVADYTKLKADAANAETIAAERDSAVAAKAAAEKDRDDANAALAAIGAKLNAMSPAPHA